MHTLRIVFGSSTLEVVAMAKMKKYDEVIEAVRYLPQGKIQWVRAYERRGFVFSDHFLLNRDSLIERLKNGDRIFVGQRKPYLGNDFELDGAVRLVKNNGNEIVVAGDTRSQQDHLEGVPIF
jgi:hypothetical protein